MKWHTNTQYSCQSNHACRWVMLTSFFCNTHRSVAWGRTDLWTQAAEKPSTDHLTAGEKGRRGERRGRRIEEDERSLSGELTDSSSSKTASRVTNHNGWWEDKDTAAVMCVRLHQLKHQTADSLQLRQSFTYCRRPLRIWPPAVEVNIQPAKSHFSTFRAAFRTIKIL